MRITTVPTSRCVMVGFAARYVVGVTASGASDVGNVSLGGLVISLGGGDCSEIFKLKRSDNEKSIFEIVVTVGWSTVD